MFVLESYESGGALVVNRAYPYRATFNAATHEEAVAIVVALNQTDMLNALAAHRFEFETAGLDIGGGIQIKTDRESQGQIANAFVSLNFDLIPDTPFKAVEGWSTVTKAQILPIAKATAAHTRACFSGEKAVQDLIGAAKSADDIAAISIEQAFSAAYVAAYAEVMQPTGA
ncbi:DUF4376 domain-containing protein (plasmid) [Pseudomonas sp. B26140]|uniref:DUF4376 domain-containing protein n=1 Tax=Pseudomonas sp. B26140 TaxID=3235112 RepID=UPI003784BA1A